MSWRFRLLVAVLAGAVSSSAAAAAPVTDVVLGTTAVEWTALGDFAGMKLRVSGPLGVTESDFAAGENPLFDLRTLEVVADGLYTWEIVASPRLDESARRTMAGARTAGGEVEAGLRSALPDASQFVQSGSFRVVDGAILQPTGTPEPASEGARRMTGNATGGGATRAAAADQVIPDDLIVQGSVCVGFDCVNNESFGFDTIRLKENNTRIKFEDTSSTTGFPSNDWQLTANDSASGGSNKFSIEDITGAKVPFTLTAGASTNSIFVDSTGRVGFRTSTPVLDLHVSTSNTPAIRLEQTSAGGFTAQTWDVAGNEANFFVRDVTSGSRLPFRIRPGAPTSSLDISRDGFVGVGTASPDEELHVAGSDGDTAVMIEETSGTAATRTMLNITNNGGSRIGFFNTSSGNNWQFSALANFNIDFSGTAGVEMQVGSDGNVTVSGTLTTGGPTCGAGCDEVFAADYPLESIEQHAEAMFANSYLPAVGPTQPKAPFNVTEKTGGILNELEKAHIYIAQLNDRVKQKDAQLDDLHQRLATLEAALAALTTQP